MCCENEGLIINLQVNTIRKYIIPTNHLASLAEP